MGIISRSSVNRKPSESMRLIVTTFVGVVFGFFIGASLPKLSTTKLSLPSSLLPSIDLSHIEDKYTGSYTWSFMKRSNRSSSQDQSLIDSSKTAVDYTFVLPHQTKNLKRMEKESPNSCVEAESKFSCKRIPIINPTMGLDSLPWNEASNGHFLPFKT